MFVRSIVVERTTTKRNSFTRNKIGKSSYLLIFIASSSSHGCGWFFRRHLSVLTIVYCLSEDKKYNWTLNSSIFKLNMRKSIKGAGICIRSKKGGNQNVFFFSGIFFWESPPCLVVQLTCLLLVISCFDFLRTLLL